MRLLLHGAEECPDVAYEEVGDFHGGEVSAAREFAPVHNGREVTVGQAAQWNETVVREDGHAKGYVQWLFPVSGQHLPGRVGGLSALQVGDLVVQLGG